ncbi:hypothetical protein SEVIR_9G183650v4 [Setaria viridis]
MRRAFLGAFMQMAWTLLQYPTICMRVVSSASGWSSLPWMHSLETSNPWGRMECHWTTRTCDDRTSSESCLMSVVPYAGTACRTACRWPMEDMRVLPCVYPN